MRICPICDKVVYPGIEQRVHVLCLSKMTTEQYFDYLETKNCKELRSLERGGKSA